MYLIKTKHDNYDGFMIVDHESDDCFYVPAQEGENEVETATNYIISNGLSDGAFFVSRAF